MRNWKGAASAAAAAAGESSNWPRVLPCVRTLSRTALFVLEQRVYDALALLQPFGHVGFANVTHGFEGARENPRSGIFVWNERPSKPDPRSLSLFFFAVTVLYAVYDV